MTISIAVHRPKAKLERPPLEKGQWRVIRRFEGGIVELEDYRGRRIRQQSIPCPKCGEATWDSTQRLIDPRWACPDCVSKENNRRAAAAAAAHRKRRQIMFENGETSPQRRAAILLLASPAWRDRKAIKAIYAEAKRKTKETGIVHHVDHIYPLQGEMACGLHVHWNLRVIPAAENCSKGSDFPLDQSPAWDDLELNEIAFEWRKMVNEFNRGS